jgi:CSLREA domain-containing protein
MRREHGERALVKRKKPMKKFVGFPIGILFIGWFLVSCGGSPGTPSPTPASEFTVNTTDDAGQGLCNNPGGSCSLREAIQRANATAGTVLIRFNIPGSEVLKMIRPNTPLPAITNTVILDGTTQPGFTNGPIIELEGSYTPGSSGLTIQGAGSVVKDLIIVDFTGNGINIQAPDVIIAGSYIGTDGGADVHMPNDGWGIDITCGSVSPVRAVIGGSAYGDRNVISGNRMGGIRISAGGCGSFESRATIQGNFIGTDAAGTAALGNGGPGISIVRASRNTIGGLGVPEGNVISSNDGNGVEILGSASQKNNIQANTIGTNSAGDAAMGNKVNGIYSEGDVTLIGGETAGASNLISGNAVHGIAIYRGPTLIEGNRIGLNRTGTAALGNVIGVQARSCDGTIQIGGETPATRNVISGNQAEGILIDDTGCSSGQVNIWGNYIGTDLSATAAIGNLDGIHVMAPNVVIGGESGQYRNKISGNHNNGIVIERDHTQVIGNFIGTEVNGIAALGNEYNAVVIRGTASHTTVKFNTVAYNGGFGVWVMGDGTGNLVTQNKIHDNGVLGIAIDEPNVILNDPLDADTGANGRQNFPTVESAFISGDNAVVMGTMQGAANTHYQIELFANDACDPSGYGEGQRFMVDTTATTDGTGSAEFHGGISVSSFLLTPGMFITATATDPNGSTSGFSQCVPVTQAPTPTLAPTSGGMQFKPSVYPSEFFYGGCAPDRTDISVEVLDPPEEISYVLLFVRLVDQKTGAATPWNDGLSMSNLGQNKFLFTLVATKIPEYDQFDNAWLQYQFVAYNKGQKEIGRSDVYGDVAFRKCGQGMTTPTKPGIAK